MYFLITFEHAMWHLHCGVNVSACDVPNPGDHALRLTRPLGHLDLGQSLCKVQRFWLGQFCSGELRPTSSRVHPC
jgi:hypothetical protein